MSDKGWEAVVLMVVMVMIMAPAIIYAWKGREDD